MSDEPKFLTYSVRKPMIAISKIVAIEPDADSLSATFHMDNKLKVTWYFESEDDRKHALTNIRKAMGVYV